MTWKRVPTIALRDDQLPLVLVGLPGAGKTTQARLLAQALGVQVTDTDAEIRRRARMTIPEIFASEGEEGFRDREHRAMRAVLDSPAAAHGVIVPVEAEFFALRGVALLVETIETVRDRINPRLKIDGIVATMVDSRTLHSREVLQRLQEAFGDLVFDTRIGRTIKFPDASVATEPIISDGEKNKYRRQ